MFLSLCGLGVTPALPTGYSLSKRVRSFLNDVLAADTTNPGLHTLSVEVDELDNQISQLHKPLFIQALKNRVVRHFNSLQQLPIYTLFFVCHCFATRNQRQNFTLQALGPQTLANEPQIHQKIYFTALPIAQICIQVCCPHGLWLYTNLYCCISSMHP